MRGVSTDASHFPFESVPVEGGAWVNLVRLDMVMAKDTPVGIQLIRRKDFAGDGSIGVAGEIRSESGKDAGEGGGQAGEGGVLLRGEVILDEVDILDATDDRIRTCGASDEVRGGDAGGLHPLGEDESDPGGIVGVPGFEASTLSDGKGAGLGDFDPDAAGVGGGGVPGAFLEVEGLIEGAVDIEHEMDAEAAFVVEDLETTATGTGGIEVDDKLVDAFPEIFELPSAAPHGLHLGGIEAIASQAVAVG